MRRKIRYHFIRLFEQAVNSSDRPKAFRIVLEEIKAKGPLPEFREGLKNFQFFIAILSQYSSIQSDNAILLKEGILETRFIDILRANISGGDKEKRAIADIIKSDPGLSSEFQNLKTEIAKFRTMETPFIIAGAIGIRSPASRFKKDAQF